MATINRLSSRAQINEPPLTVNIDHSDIICQWPTEALLSANLDALVLQDPALVKLIEQCDNLTGYTLTICDDGSITYCQQDETGETHWLGNNSLPIIFSQNNVETANINHVNVALEYLNDGYEAITILKTTNPYQALFLIENNIQKIRMAFQLHDFSAYIATGRLVIIHDQVLNSALDQFYQTHPGYNLIQKTLSFHTRDPKENHQFSDRITAAIQIAHDNVVQKINNLTIAIDQYYQTISPKILKQSIAPNSDHNRCAINITSTYSAQDKYASRDILTSLRAVQFKTKWTTYDQPHQISIIEQLNLIDTLHPNLYLLIDVFPSHTNVRIPQQAITVSFIHWFDDDVLTKYKETIEAFTENNFIFSSNIATVALIQKHAPLKNHIHYLPLVANCNIYHTGYEKTNDYHKNNCDVLFLGDRASDQPKKYNISLPSHQNFWQHLINVIANYPEHYFAQDAFSVVIKAQEYGIPIKKEEVRKLLASLVAKYLGKTVLWDVYLYQLKLINLRVNIWGHVPFSPLKSTDNLPASWDESIVKQCVKGTVSDGEDFNALLNQCRIFIDINDEGKPTQTVLNACASGTFVMIKSHPDDNKPGGWGDYFDIGKELITFTTPEDMLTKVNHYLKNGQERLQVATAAQQRCITDHNCHDRGAEMLKRIYENL